MEKREGNVYIGSTGAKIIGALFLTFNMLIAYIYVSDQVYRDQQEKEFNQKLKVFDVQLKVMTDVLRLADPEIDEKIFRELYREKEKGYRGGYQINQNYEQDNNIHKQENKSTAECSLQPDFNSGNTSEVWQLCPGV